MGEKDPVILFRTWDYSEAVQIQAILNGSEIPCEILGGQHSSMTLMGGGPALAIRIIVPPSREEDARILLKDFLENLPEKEGEFEESGVFRCPHCDKEFEEKPSKCPECQFAVFQMPEGAPVLLKKHSPDAASFCSLCGVPSTAAEGKCGECKGELTVPEEGDALCGNEKHVVERKPLQKGHLDCITCQSVWVAGLK